MGGGGIGRMLDFGCWMLVRRRFGRLRPLADAWVVGWIGANVCACSIRSCLANRTQIGLPLFAEALEFVEGTVKSSFQTAFLAVEQGQGAFAPGGCVAHATGIIKIEILLHASETLQLAGVETGFLMVEAAESPGGHG